MRPSQPRPGSGIVLLKPALSPPSTVRLCSGNAAQRPVASPLRNGSPPPEDASRRRRGDPERCLPEAWEKHFELSPEERLLGSGAFAKISKVVERSSGEAFALKAMSRPNFAVRGIAAQVDAEIEALRRCAEEDRCRHVLRFFSSAEEREHAYIRMELCVCDLLRFASCQTTGRLSEPDARYWSRQLFLGLGDLHSLGIIHRDIKPENLLISSEGVLKIGDFGWCADLATKPCTLAGTLQYMAPEVLRAQELHTPAVDVWSAGVTMLQLLTRRQLLTTYLGPGATGLSAAEPHRANQVKTMRLLTEIQERCPLPAEGRPPYLDERPWTLLVQALVPDLKQRLTIPGTLSHAWLALGEEGAKQGLEEQQSRERNLKREPPPAPPPALLTRSPETASMPVLHAAAPPVVPPLGKRVPATSTRDVAKSQPPTPMRRSLVSTQRQSSQRESPQQRSLSPGSLVARTTVQVRTTNGSLVAPSVSREKASRPSPAQRPRTEMRKGVSALVLSPASSPHLKARLSVPFSPNGGSMPGSIAWSTADGLSRSSPPDCVAVSAAGSGLPPAIDDSSPCSALAPPPTPVNGARRAVRGEGVPHPVVICQPLTLPLRPGPWLSPRQATGATNRRQGTSPMSVSSISSKPTLIDASPVAPNIPVAMATPVTCVPQPLATLPSTPGLRDHFRENLPPAVPTSPVSLQLGPLPSTPAARERFRESPAPLLSQRATGRPRQDCV